MVLRFSSFINSPKSSLKKRGFNGKISKPLCDEYNAIRRQDKISSPTCNSL
jgi:hypothetical protein